MSPLNLLKQISSWKEFKLKLEHLNKKEKGDCFELIVKYYLQINLFYKTNLKKNA